jgi:uncharacterized protein YbbC (DUF1343 family)/CubicO group peptidase (beta-lactamase class C family)
MPAASKPSLAHATFLAPLLALAACSAPPSAPAPAPAAVDEPAPLDRAALGGVTAAVRAAVEAGTVPGAVVLIGRDEEALLLEAVGARALQPEHEAMTSDTVFDLASLTKPVATATSVLVLVDEGRVRLDAPVTAYLPELAGGGKERITVEHLLRHRGGLIPDNPLADYAEGPEQAWRRICALEVTDEPGTAFAYTDVGYIVLGQLVERVDGRPLDVFAREEVFGPLGMDATGFRPDFGLAARAAPTERRGERGEGWMRGEVHDPRAFALGGVAGHAGLFSTAEDLARWCRMLLAGGTLEGRRVLSREATAAMLTPTWLPDGSAGRTLGLDADTRYSSARGGLFPRGASVGHTGFTGTSLWLDPQTGGYVVLLASRLHPDGEGSVGELRSAVATAAARALRPAPPDVGVLAGADVLAREGCARLRGRRVALVTNTTGRTREGERTVDLLARAEGVELVCLMSPEHGLYAAIEGDVADAVDAPTGLPVWSLYGATKRPTERMLAGVDTIVFDVQDAGVRFYTYATTLGYVMEAAAERGLRVVVLDRPNPIGFLPPAGPCADAERLDFVAYAPIPIVHGLTLGELARLYRDELGVRCELEVVPCQGWERAMAWEDTGLTWVDPSPNLRNPTEALLYPGVALVEFCDVSVGRGTDEPFERLGAPWIDGPRLAAALNASGLPGLAFSAVQFTPRASRFEGERCSGVHVDVTDRAAVRPVEAGLAIAWHLLRLHPDAFDVERVDVLLRSRRAWEALMTVADPADLPALWSEELAAFREARERCLLYD